MSLKLKKTIFMFIALANFIVTQTLQAQEREISSNFTKKYTNADFYRNGIFQKDVAKKAVKDMLKFYNELYTPKIDQEIWVSDFGLGDFEHVGLSSVTWFNDPTYYYFAMTMYLLPDQMIPEHIHHPIASSPAKPAKYESWKAIRGWVYNFSEIGPHTPDPPAIPSSFGKVISENYRIMKAGETQALRKIETWHFMMAGPGGAIVDEYGVYHDRRGWFSSNPKARPAN